MKKELKALFEVDRKFCELASKIGAEGWEYYLSKKAIMGTSKHEGYIEGKKLISNLVGMIYSLDNIDFKWEPKHGFMSEDNTLGVTTGVYTRKYKIENETFEEKGKYTTTWMKEDGEWKIVFDMGN